LLGCHVPRLDVQADATNLRGALNAHVSLDGEIDRKPARASLHIARPVAGGAVLDGVDVSIGSVSAQGGVALDTANFAAGRISASAMLAGSPDHLGGNWIGRLLPKTIAVTVPRITRRRSAGNSFKIQHDFLIN
jgi:hypothetical protein